MAIGPSAPDGEAADQGDSAVHEAAREDEQAAVPWSTHDEEEDPSSGRDLGWLALAVLILAGLAWTAFFGWANRELLSPGTSPVQWTRLIVDWSVPILLLGVLWLLAMRNSRREAARFTSAAGALSSESQRLEQRLVTVNRELSLARDFIAAQSRDLESLGRIAAERLSQNADRLQALIRDNGEQVETIGRVSSTALGNMDRLRDDLPVISNSARDVASQIGHAGQIARQQLEEMIVGFNRLNEFGEASGRQVETLQGKVEHAITTFEAQAGNLEDVLGQRYAALAQRSATLRAELDSREVEAFAAMRRRADALSHEMAASADQLEGHEREAVTLLSQRIAKVNEEATRLALRLREDESELGERWAASIASLEQRMREAVQQVAEVDEHATHSAQRRLAALHEEAVRVDEAIAGRLAEFDAQRGQRDTEIGEREAAALAQLEQRLAAFDQERLLREQELAERQTAALSELETRLAGLDEERQRREAQVRDHHAAALAVLEQRLATFDEERERREAALREREAAALSEVEQRILAFDTQLTERQQEHLAHVSGLTERSESLALRLRELSAHMDGLVAQGHAAQGDLTEATAGFAARVAESQAILADSQVMIARLTDDSVRLLELIRASADHGSEDLPRSIGHAEARLSAFEQQARALGELIAQAAERGSLLAAQVAEARGDSSATLDTLGALEARMSELRSRSDELAAHARDALGQSVGVLEEAAQRAVGELQLKQADAIRVVADQIGTISATAIVEALREHAVQAMAELEDVTAQASEAGRETAVQLRDQLVRVNELAANLEQRVALARQRAEEKVDNDFARRMALITESLNSSSIDISKAFANEVTDTAWASYLRGDRGIFTRRAVRLLDNQQSRAVAEIYQEDSDFRETVNRYIHDFEAMLRSVLSTRDGHALAVTLLSSDMGKLYVAMAQSIERLRV
jgi:hypothetical protein